MSRFKPGQTGNPNGRPRNAKSTVTALRKDLITDEDLQAIVDVVISKAKEGDLGAAGMILDRRLPRLRVTADFGLERSNLAEQLKAARERVMADADCRTVFEVFTGIEGGLAGGVEAPKQEETGVSEDYAPAREQFPDQYAHTREEFLAPSPAPAREEAVAVEPRSAPAPAIRFTDIGPSASPSTGHDFDPYE